MKVIDVAPGIWYLDASEAGLRILCGCPENSVKFLKRAGIIRQMEKNGVRFATGPNAVLLSEAPLLNGKFRNAAEFPVLHMLYLQGMIVPGHPNNTGERPLIIGIPRCVDELAEYVYLGNYGLTEKSEIVGGGVDEAAADEMLKIKRLFSFGSFKKTDALLELKRIDSPIIELRGGLFLRREGLDRYEFILEGESISIDLRMPDGEATGAPYTLPNASVPSATFAVTHIGEGDGWDPMRPCMGSLLSAGGGLWLIDAGPNIEYSLAALGLSLADIRGVFNSHVHDDHFLGLASLFRGERKLDYCAVPCVRRAAARKLAALARIDEEEFGMYFNVRDLVAEEWNEFGGFSVMPLIAPHPVENTLFRFKASGRNGERTYAHWADLTSFSVLESMGAPGHGAEGLSAEAIDRVKKKYLEPADLKKLDVGGGMIHGDAADFKNDASGEIFLSHTSTVIPDTPFARTARFGETTILIDADTGGRDGAHARDIPAQTEIPNSPFFSGIDSAARILSEADHVVFSEGSVLPEGVILLVVSGAISLIGPSNTSETIGEGGVAGLESLFPRGLRLFTVKARGRVEAVRIEPRVLSQVPALLWRARELYTERLLRAEKKMPFVWRAEYDMNLPQIDAGHRKLFLGIERLCEGSASIRSECRESLREAMLEHFAVEEEMMAAACYPWLNEHRRHHEKMLTDFFVDPGPQPRESVIDSLKDCFVRHTLITDRRYLPWLD